MSEPKPSSPSKTLSSGGPWPSVSRARALEAVGPGWASLVGKLYDLIETASLPVRVAQVKEKFGGLRFYYDITSEGEMLKIEKELFRTAVHLAEEVSFRTCEECGQPGSTAGSVGWIRTLCPACRIVHDNQRNGDF